MRENCVISSKEVLNPLPPPLYTACIDLDVKQNLLIYLLRVLEFVQPFYKISFFRFLPRHGHNMIQFCTFFHQIITEISQKLFSIEEKVTSSYYRKIENLQVMTFEIFLTTQISTQGLLSSYHESNIPYLKVFFSQKNRRGQKARKKKTKKLCDMISTVMLSTAQNFSLKTFRAPHPSELCFRPFNKMEKISKFEGGGNQKSTKFVFKSFIFFHMINRTHQNTFQ